MNTNNTNNAKNSIKRKSISKNPQYKTESFIVFHLIDLKCINALINAFYKLEIFNPPRIKKTNLVWVCPNQF